MLTVAQSLGKEGTNVFNHVFSKLVSVKPVNRASLVPNALSAPPPTTLYVPTMGSVLKVSTVPALVNALMGSVEKTVDTPLPFCATGTVRSPMGNAFVIRVGQHHRVSIVSTIITAQSVQQSVDRKAIALVMDNAIKMAIACAMPGLMCLFHVPHASPTISHSRSAFVCNTRMGMKVV